jgi:hypothetical protein
VAINTTTTITIPGRLHFYSNINVWEDENNWKRLFETATFPVNSGRHHQKNVCD